MTWGILDVRECGAQGDGRADDTEPILRAIDQLPQAGGVLYFPPGVLSSKQPTLTSRMPSHSILTCRLSSQASTSSSNTCSSMISQLRFAEKAWDCPNWFGLKMLPQWAWSSAKALNKEARQTSHVCNIYRFTQDRKILAKGGFGIWYTCSLCTACKCQTLYRLLQASVRHPMLA